jgi:hypothetical protein
MSGVLEWSGLRALDAYFGDLACRLRVVSLGLSLR